MLAPSRIQTALQGKRNSSSALWRTQKINHLKEWPFVQTVCHGHYIDPLKDSHSWTTDNSSIRWRTQQNIRVLLGSGSHLLNHLFSQSLLRSASLCRTFGSVVLQLRSWEALAVGKKNYISVYVSFHWFRKLAIQKALETITLWKSCEKVIFSQAVKK